jgi:hypothetical protein
MGKLREFFGIMFSEWGSGLSGPASVPFTVLALFSPNSVQKIAYASLAVLLGLFSSYRIWLRENHRAIFAEKRCSDSKPRLAFTATSEKLNHIYMRKPVFKVNHLGGEAAQFIQIQHIRSANGRNVWIEFAQIDFLDSTAKSKSPDFELVIAGTTTKPNDKRSHLQFIFFDRDRKDGSRQTRQVYPVVIRFSWNREWLEEKVNLVWDRNKQLLTTEPLDIL